MLLLIEDFSELCVSEILLRDSDGACWSNFAVSFRKMTRIQVFCHVAEKIYVLMNKLYLIKMSFATTSRFLTMEIWWQRLKSFLNEIIFLSRTINSFIFETSVFLTFNLLIAFSWFFYLEFYLFFVPSEYFVHVKLPCIFQTFEIYLKYVFKKSIHQSCTIFYFNSFNFSVRSSYNMERHIGPFVSKYFFIWFYQDWEVGIPLLRVLFCGDLIHVCNSCFSSSRRNRRVIVIILWRNNHNMLTIGFLISVRMNT